MKKPWSISTTVRNPERIKPFLQVLSEFEGVTFDEEQQIKFQIKLIQNKLYMPESLEENKKEYYHSPKEMSFEQAKEIFKHMRDNSNVLNEDPGLRGRTSAAPLAKMGLAIIKKTRGEVRLTKLGRKFLNNEVDISDVYLRFFYNWSLYNPDSKFTEEDGFNIRPFIATLKIIYLVNQKCEENGLKVKGVSKKEFSVYVLTTIDYKNIDSTVDEIIALRKELLDKDQDTQNQIENKFYFNRINTFFEDDGSNYEINFNNLKDYGDNAIRYLKLTRFFQIHGGEFYFDLEQRRKIEIESLLEESDGRRLKLNTLEEYYDFIESEKEYPWETREKLIAIVKELRADINSLNDSLRIKIELKDDLFEENIEVLSIEKLSKLSKELRFLRRKVQEQKNHLDLLNIDKFEEVIYDLSNIHHSDKDKSIELEYLATLCLHAINDAKKIQPNYPVGDDNKPTFTAPADVPDIECFYESFNMICEVTMLTTRTQWINEGQPVMRHLRDFENKNSNNSFCLFIAPRIHRDTFNTFKMANKYEYEGRSQKIVPLNISQFKIILEKVLNKKIKNNPITHEEFKKLLEILYEKAKDSTDISEWINKSNELLHKFEEEDILA
ncbi:MAG TPA: AlwI family type II restriction endonuclease [Methanofastidiosum sp.]|nr:AlwI family type II restriction endonuclease [Methanofastidiosum sp.]HNU61947.1 AlwI family type II restriction endonuclease [Methanofastidiosum sp.]